MSKTQGGPQGPPLNFNPPYRALKWGRSVFHVLDQRRLPAKKTYLEITGLQVAGDAIKTLAVRGAPLIGAFAALSLAHLARKGASRNKLLRALRVLAGTRPTAVNLFWSLERMKPVIEKGESQDIVNEALAIFDEEKRRSWAMSRAGGKLIENGMRIGTYCNTGILATPGLGTALGVILKAHLDGKRIEVLVPETRPLLQGARLTAWELSQWKIPYTLVTESAIASKAGELDLVLVGADRIAANGDTANKVGTHGLAILCRHFRVPFYVVAPSSTVDTTLPKGKDIPIEERSPQEVTRFRTCWSAPRGAAAANPAFDVTPQELISGFITEKGIITPPYRKGLAE